VTRGDETGWDEESLNRNKGMLRLRVKQAEKIATLLGNKIALHENFMIVQPIAAGTRRTEVKTGLVHEDRGMRKTGKFNDTELASGKLGIQGGEIRKRIPYKICCCDNIGPYLRDEGLGIH
jgi:hypothetical protein